MEARLTDVLLSLTQAWKSLKPEDDSGECLYNPKNMDQLKLLVTIVDRLWNSEPSRIVDFFERPHLANLLTKIIRFFRLIHGSRIIRIQRFEFHDSASGLNGRIADQWFRWICRTTLLMVFWQQHTHHRAYMLPGFPHLEPMTDEDIHWLSEHKIISPVTADMERQNLSEVVVPPLSACKQQISQLLNTVSDVYRAHPAWKKMFSRIYVRFCFFVTDMSLTEPSDVYMRGGLYKFGRKLVPHVHDVPSDLDAKIHVLSITASQNLEVSLRNLFAFMYRDIFLSAPSVEPFPGPPHLNLTKSTHGLLCILADMVVHSTISTDIMSNLMQMVLGLCAIPGGVEQMERLSLRWTACSQQFMISFKPKLYDTLAEVVMSQTGLYTLLAEAFHDLGLPKAFPQVTAQKIRDLQQNVPLHYRKLILQALCVVVFVEVSTVIDPQFQINDLICMRIYHDRFERWGIKDRPAHPRLISMFGAFELLLPDGSRYDKFPVNDMTVVSAIQPVVYWLSVLTSPSQMLREFSCILVQ